MSIRKSYKDRIMWADPFLRPLTRPGYGSENCKAGTGAGPGSGNCLPGFAAGRNCNHFGMAAIKNCNPGTAPGKHCNSGGGGS